MYRVEKIPEFRRNLTSIGWSHFANTEKFQTENHLAAIAHVSFFPRWVFYLSEGRREERHERREERTGDKQSGPTPLLPLRILRQNEQKKQKQRAIHLHLQGSRNKKARGDVTRANLNLRLLREFGTRDAPMRATVAVVAHIPKTIIWINAICAALEFSKTRRIVFFSILRAQKLNLLGAW